VLKKHAFFYRHLGERVRAYREIAGLSQAALGKRLSPSMSRANIANIENAQQQVLVHTLFEIAGVLGVPVATLIPRRLS
jgi:transcriptional regulator with XRE-family HTH domain